jgi:hypothetical protein
MLRVALPSPAMKTHDTQLVIRCPYCVSGFDFRELISYKDGRFVCEMCAHTIHPGEISYQCSCRGCLKMSNADATLQSRWLR